jgi:predicted DNA-binding transcriptional regulator YafY
MNLSRISRLIRLLGLLQAGKGHNVNGLSQACGVSRRTIFRDLDVLRQAGVPRLLDDDQGVYRIPGSYYLPPTNFTAEEALAVMVLCDELGSGSRLPFYEAAQSAALNFGKQLAGPSARPAARNNRRSAHQQAARQSAGRSSSILSAAAGLHRRAARRANRLRQLQRRKVYPY